MACKKPIIFIIGGPGSGKGTQCEIIVQKYGLTHLSTGDILREEVSSGTERGKRLNEIMKSGQLVPVDEMLAILKDVIDKKIESSNGILLDGYPRELDQAIKFEQQVAPCTLVIYLECTDDLMTERLLERAKSSGRVDDNEETIKIRLKTFHQHTDLLLDHFKDKNLVNVNGLQTPDDVFKEISSAIDRHLKL